MACAISSTVTYARVTSVSRHRDREREQSDRNRGQEEGKRNREKGELQGQGEQGIEL